jgi:hypothetical protein
LRYLRSSTSAPEEEQGKDEAGESDGDQDIRCTYRNVQGRREVFDGKGEGSGEKEELEEELGMGRHG